MRRNIQPLADRASWGIVVRHFSKVDNAAAKVADVTAKG